MKSIVTTITSNVFLAVFLTVFTACHTDRRLDALEQSGENRTELEKVLIYYQDDGQKQQAAQFLLENMDAHYTLESPAISRFHQELDSLYAFIKGSPKSECAEIVFPVETELRGKTVPIDTVLFHYPYRMEVRNDRVVIEDLHGQNHFYHLFTYPDFRYLSSFGQRGEGPEEMLTVDDFRWDGQTLWALDNIKSELVRWELNKSRDRMLRMECIKLDKATFRALDIVPFQGNSFLIPNYSGDSRFCQVDRKGKLIKKWGEIPTERKDDLQKYPFAYGYGWRSFIDYSSKNGTLAAATQFGEVLEIWNVKKKTHKVVRGKLGEPKFEISGSYAIPASVKGYNDIQVTNSAIYVIFRGIPIKKERLSYQRGNRMPEGGNTIRVFSLDGEPLKEYKLDHSVSGIWVMEEEGKLWTLDVNSDDPIVVYDLKG